MQGFVRLRAPPNYCKQKEHLAVFSQRVDKVDTLIRQTKMDADEEARSRQYEGTAMSDDEVSKVCKILPFGFLAKRDID